MYQDMTATAEYRDFRQQFPNGYHHVTGPEAIDALWKRGCELADPESPVSEFAREKMGEAQTHIYMWAGRRGKYGELNCRLAATIALFSLVGITTWSKNSSRKKQTMELVGAVTA